MPEGVEGWKLREDDHYCRHHSYELIQFQGSIGKKVRIHDLVQPKKKGKKKKETQFQNYNYNKTKRHVFRL